jgi:hypothetical protein
MKLHGLSFDYCEDEESNERLSIFTFYFCLFTFAFYQAPKAGITFVANNSMDRITCS